MLSIIVAIGKNRAIGKNNSLLWHIPEDLKRFKRLTARHPVIMGRKTFDSIIATLGKPLPGRTNIVVTHDINWKFEGIVSSQSLHEAIERAHKIDQHEIFVIGGGQIYQQALPLTDRIYLTLVESDLEGDTFFPSYEHIFTKNIFEEGREWRGLKYRWIDLER